MRINLINRKTGKSERISFKKMPLKELKKIGVAAAVSNSHYLVCVTAESTKEIDFIAANFTSIPLPSPNATEAIWTGDLAIFIILNYPQ